MRIEIRLKNEKVPKKKCLRKGVILVESFILMCFFYVPNMTYKV